MFKKKKNIYKYRKEFAYKIYISLLISVIFKVFFVFVGLW